MSDKYSLEAWRHYPETRLCPPLHVPQADALFTTFALPWAQLETERGQLKVGFAPGTGHSAAMATTPGPGTLLAPELTPPAWAGEGFDAALLADHFLRRLGAALDGGKGWLGVLAEMPASLPQEALPALLRAYAQGFNDTFVILRADDSACIAEARRQGMLFGLLLDARSGLLPVREVLAGQSLQRVWQTAPVLLQAQGAPEGPEAVSRAALGWHVAAIDLTGARGPAMALRRLTFPTNVSADGAMPLRFWWQNAGSAPLYTPSRVRLWLRGLGAVTGSEAEIPLHDEKPMRLLGDAVHNEITQLPTLAAGQYELLCALQDANGVPLPLAIDLPQTAGRYALGAVTLDTIPRPELYRAWDNYYPEGYYPLEDPKLPV